MLKLKENSKRSPFGGHHYPEYGVVFRGESFSDVVEKLSKFRLNNNIPAGNPEQDVLNFYIKHWPWLVREHEYEPAPPADDFKAWSEWVYKTWRNPPLKMVTPKEASHRWSACVTCPMNRSMADWPETEEMGEVKRRAFVLRRGLDVPEDLGFCACHLADLGVFSFIENAKHFSAQEGEEKPASCWVV